MHESWMDYGPLDATGWPTMLPDAEREALTAHVKEALTGHHMGLMDLHSLLRADINWYEKFPAFSRFALWDAILYTLDRAARAANARRVYTVEG